MMVAKALFVTARLAAVAGMAVAGFTCGSGVAGADDPPPPPGPPLRHVKYTVTTDQPYYADIYYRDTDPPNWADFSHNSYLYSPKVEADIGPGRPWVLETWLVNPDAWAMVMATSGDVAVRPQFHCELRVDNAVVSTDDGPSGALCSIRPW